MARDTNFYYSFLVLPASQRRAIVSVWDFCRAVDDAVDEPAEGDPESIGRALTFWRAEVDRVFGEAQPASEQGRAVQPLVAQFGLPRKPFDDLIDGVAMDVGDRRYATFSDLREYCYRVASTVGLICVAIFGGRSEAARQYAVELGLALQLTNILRDVPTDLARGRLYIPLDELRRFGCSEDDLRAARLDKVRPLLAHQGARARDTTPGRGRPCRVANGGSSWQPRSWAPSIAGSSPGSSDASTCFPPSCGCPGHDARSSPRRPG